MRLYKVMDDGYVAAHNELEALNAYLENNKNLGFDDISFVDLPFTVSKPLYGTKLMNFNIPGILDSFAEYPVSKWLELVGDTPIVLGYEDY